MFGVDYQPFLLEQARMKRSEDWGRGGPIDVQRILDLKRKVPFIGLADIGIYGTPLFQMFAANDDLIVLGYAWFGADANEPASLAIWSALCKRAEAAVLDVGSFTGLFSLCAAKANPALKIYAFEPARLPFARLVLNVQFNGARKSISVIPEAIGSSIRSGIMNWRREPETLSTAGTLESVDGGILHSEFVMVRDLDSFVFLECAGAVSLIKVDVERHELNVVRGMGRILNQARPIILIEIARPDRTAVIDALNDHQYAGYRILEKEGRLENIRSGAAPIENCLFVPNERNESVMPYLSEVLSGFNKARTEPRASS